MEEDDIAAAMGFSAFGGNKKRKYDASNSPKSQAAGKGANSIPLGVRTKATKNEGDESIVPSSEAASQPKFDTKGKQKQPPASGLADFLARGQVLEAEKASDAQQSATTTSHGQDEISSESVSFGGPAIPQAELAALRRGVRNEEGDMVYFQPSFVEDPWEKLEQQRR
ncbi:hypothetical protein BDV96DRAFT_652650 [Lophiotrema nucula]|uniref:Uncharacterized protein n=1 Tax=Lophiotrema nucula TaxID=690887 RepID=A0A6A5YNS4_9PLEO|nr:hypothetical protein BDV96DRAFT_652650 [Lophiotrema nucula]